MMKNLSFLDLATHITLCGDDPDKTFARVRETLTRMGIAKDNALTQSCYILHKRGKYYIMHYKMMRYLNGGDNTVEQRDVDITATIAGFLSNWGMVKVTKYPAVFAPNYDLTVVKYSDINNWTLEPKCVLGQRNKDERDGVETSV
ncbi:translational regulator [Vibrio phage 1.244.A._10N.261.54.C3]|nr:translational regulator [Vibrio phage 1.244.A._10N.261.54.C3]AUR98651.1 translational regulator [Vibrio phage 1.255.O._10N.286.45.F1]